MALSDVLVDIDELSVHYAKEFGGHPTKAVDRASLRIFRGEILSLVGESGSGKTTLARVIAGLVRPTEGTVRFDGKITRYKRGELRRLWRKVQMVFQDPYTSFNPLSTVVDSLRIPLEKYGIAKDSRGAKEAIEKALGEVGLNYDEMVGRYPRELSGGQRQRASIARAMIVQPEILVADEPVSMLDVSLRIGIFNLLRNLNRTRSITILFITHDLAAARYLGGRTAVMYKGQILETARTEDLIRKPLSPYTGLLLSAAPKLNSDDWLRNRDMTDRGIREQNAQNQGCSFFSRCPNAGAPCKEDKPLLEESTLVEGEGHDVACHFPLLGEATKPADAVN